MSQQRWLITGCSSGIGEFLVRKLLAQGDQVVATTRGNVSRLASLKQIGAETVSLDVTDSPKRISQVINEILKCGSIDVLVNNAGYLQSGLAEELGYAKLGSTKRGLL